MNTFKRKALFTAVVAGFGAAAGTAEAVFLAPNGTGQVLVYPYYTARSNGTDSWNTYISVVNTTDFAKAVKVRVLEGKTSAEVLDFNLFLSANDVWAAAIVPTSDGAKIITGDKSCTAPAIPFPDGQAFRNFQYTGQAAGLGRTLDRTREGYVEIIEMATLSGAFAAAVTHDATGIPDDCAAVRVPDYTIPFTLGVDYDVPTGGLMGTGTLISPNTGLDTGYKADALEAFSDTAILTSPGDTQPSLQQPSPTSSVVFNSGFDPAIYPVGNMNLTVYRQDFSAATGSHATPGAQAVASVYMHETVMNEYILDAGTASLTDWVLTQPTKNFFVDDVTAAPPYTEVLTADGACEEISFTYFNREEIGATAGGIDFSPPPPAGPGSSICWESTVLSIVNDAAHMPADDTVSGVLFSKNTKQVAVRDGFENGWARITFVGDNAFAGAAVPVGLTSDPATSDGAAVPAIGPTTAFGPAAATQFGLPVTGFMIRTFTRDNIACNAGACQGNYSALFPHSYRSLNTTP
jgi:hypothetical protein